MAQIKAKYYSLKAKFSSLSRTGKIKLLTVLLIVLVIPLTVVLALTRQDLRQRASTPQQKPMVGAYYFGWFSPQNFTDGADYGFTRQWRNGVPVVSQTNRYGTLNLYKVNGVDPLSSERDLNLDPWAGVRDLYMGNEADKARTVFLRQIEKDQRNLWWSAQEAPYRRHFKPLIGYYDNSDPAVLQQQIDQATSRGISYFNFYWGWTSLTHKEAYVSAIKAFMDAPNPKKMKFMVSIWQAAGPWYLTEADIEPATDKLAEYIKHEDYLKIDGVPIVQLGNVNAIKKDINSPLKDNATLKLFIDRLRAKTGNIILTYTIMNDQSAADVRSNVLNPNVDAYTCLVPISANYVSSSNQLTSRFNNWALNGKPFIPCAISGWDERPRIGLKKDLSTFYKEIWNPNNPEGNLFKNQLQRIKTWMNSKPSKLSKYLNIYAWNEWHEGGIIEPHVAPNSYAYLNAIQSVFALPPWDGNIPSPSLTPSLSPTPSLTPTPSPSLIPTLKPSPTPSPSVRPSPVAVPKYDGYFDTLTCNTIGGWAADRNKLNTSINVDVYFDTSFYTSILANRYRPDVASYLGDNGLHGFRISTPAVLKDGLKHTVTVYYGGTKKKLNTNDKTVTCSPN